MKKHLIILSILGTPHFVVQAYARRGYFAIGGEWLIILLTAVIIYGFVPLAIKLGRECLGDETEKADVKERTMYA